MSERGPAGDDYIAVDSFQVISLNGPDWQFKGYLGEDWGLRRAFHPETRDLRHWLPGQVPGSVLADLWRAGEVPDPYFERNSLLLEWVPARTWVYKKRFTIGSEHQGKRVRLHLVGVDYSAQFYLNGELLGGHCGMFTSAVFEIGERLKFGEENLLAIVIEPAPPGESQVGRTSRVRVHKSRMNYGWDFCPRMVHQGIWQDVLLEVSGPARIEDVFVRPQLKEGLRKAIVAVSVRLSSNEDVSTEVDVHLEFDGKFIASRRSDAFILRGVGDMDFELELEDPQLWWPNGYGEQPLYEADVSVFQAGSSGEEIRSDRRRTVFGIRKIEFISNMGAPPDARPYTLRVNDRVIYMNGWNWVSLDVLYGVEQPEKLERLIHLAVLANVNLLRVWGGGLIEKESFYSLCDQNGILVWQEFIQSSSGIDNEPSRSSEFVAKLAAEAEQIIPGKRNHPSLAVWCGGNELQTFQEPSQQRPLDDDHPVQAALKAVVQRLDPDRHWLPTSPSGPHFAFSLSNASQDPGGCQDVHGPWEHQGVNRHQELYNQGVSLLHSEFGVEGLANGRALDVTISKERQWPVRLENPVWEHRGSWWLKEATLCQVFGELSDIETTVRAAQFLQADGLRYAVEAGRRRQFTNSGTLPWQFNESYPMAACTSAVDYDAEPKPAYYAVAGAYEPLLLSASFPKQAWAGESRFECQIWASNATGLVYRGASLRAKIVGANGECYSVEEQPVSFAASGTSLLRKMTAPFSAMDDPVFFLDLSLSFKDGSHLAGARYVFSRTENLAPLLEVPPTRLSVETDISGDRWDFQVTNTGRPTAMFVWLEAEREFGEPGYGYFDRNHFCLFPGESGMVSVQWSGIPPGERQLAVSGWNTPVWKVSGPCARRVER